MFVLPLAAPFHDTRRSAMTATCFTTLRTLRRYAAGLDCELEINVVSADVTR